MRVLQSRLKYSCYTIKSSYNCNATYNLFNFFQNKKSTTYTVNIMDNKLPDDKTHVKITEGTATMYYDRKEEVFYNKVQVFNRDLSIQVVKLFAKIYEEEKQAKYKKKIERYESGNNSCNSSKNREPEAGITILDALAATGLRSVRYLKEIPGVRSLTINDILPAATEAARENCVLNNVDTTKVKINTGDATMLMYSNRHPNLQFDVIDLDPYGSATPFLDSAVQAVSDGGLLCVTCTDMPVLSGNYPEVCFSKYGCAPIKVSCLHEMSLRILLHAIDSTANRYGRHIVPWLSVSVDFYIRVFVRIFDSPVEVKKSALKRGMLYHSTQVPSFFVQSLGHLAAGRKLAKAIQNNESELSSSANGIKYTSATVTAPSKCVYTGGKMKIGGPFWIKEIHNQEIVDALLERLLNPPTSVAENDTFNTYPSTSPKIIGILTSMSEELKDVPFHYDLSDLASTLKIKVPLISELSAAIINAGYRVSQFHREPSAIKTDAPDEIVWDIMRAYAKIHPPEMSKTKKYPESAKMILEKPSSLENVDFTLPADFKAKKRVARYFPNPEENWGPKRKAGRAAAKETEERAEEGHVVEENEKM